MTSIVAVLCDPLTARVCLDAAASAATAVPAAEIEAFHARVRPESLILPSEEVMTARRHADLAAMLDRKSEALRLVLRAWAADHAPAAAPAWRESEGDTVDAIVAARGRTADLIVLVRPGGPDGREALNAAIFETGRLLLVAPPPGAAPALPFGRHMAVAWNGSLQADRALVAALPWLAHAARVSLLLVRDEDAPPDAADPALALLGAHGIAAQPMLVAQGGDGIGAQLLREAHATGADCLVMGAYRHSPLMEMILGGVTRHMLHAADLPLYLMH